jgi:pseudaminic acid cytidylyltransferase
LGTPIIGHSIATALACGLFDQVVVSTDDAEIAAYARSVGASTPFVRPAALADDFATTTDVMSHAVQWAKDAGWAPAYACCLYPTAPMLNAADLQRGYHVLSAAAAFAYVFSVTSFAFPIQRAIRLLPNGALDAVSPQYRDTRSQDLEPCFHDAGQFYWGRSEAWIQKIPLFSPQSLPVVLPRHVVQDIDNEEDWRMAEALCRVLKETGA